MYVYVLIEAFIIALHALIRNVLTVYRPVINIENMFKNETL